MSPSARRSVHPFLLLSCVGSCQKPLVQFLQERDLYSLDELSPAQAAVQCALGWVKSSRVIHKDGGLRAQHTKCCESHWDEIQLFISYEMGIFSDFLPLFDCRRFFDLALFNIDSEVAFKKKTAGLIKSVTSVRRRNIVLIFWLFFWIFAQRFCTAYSLSLSLSLSLSRLKKSE